MVSNLAAGGKLVMMHHFDPERALELIERERIGTFGGVPAMVMQVLDSPNFSRSTTPRPSAASPTAAPRRRPTWCGASARRGPSGSPPTATG